MNIVAKRQSKEKRGRVNFDGKACWVSVDVHKASYAVAILDEEGQRLEFSTPAEPRKLLLQLLDMGMTIKALAYESGPTSMVVWQRSTNGAIPGKLDCSPADILLADGKRYTLIGCVDVGTRRARLQVAESSNSLAVCALLRRSLLDFGVTDAVKMDNGKEYANFLVTTALLDLGIHIDWCTPFTPEEKPHIERFFLTFQRSLTTMQGFIGHSVADRKAIESRRSFAERMSRKNGEKPALEVRYTPEEFQRYCDVFCTDMYGEKKHTVLGVSPNEAAARDEGAVRRIMDERALEHFNFDCIYKQSIHLA